MIDGGLGETETNGLLAALGLPTVSDKTLKKYERIVGPAIEKIAKNSCLEAIRVEKALTLDAGDQRYDFSINNQPFLDNFFSSLLS